MKKTLLTTALVLSALTTTVAQTLNINIGDVSYAIPASQAGDMPVSNGSTLTVGAKSYNIEDITSITVNYSQVEDNTVKVNYNGTSAKVIVSGNLAPYVTATVNNAHVKIIAAPTLQQSVTYTLSGTSANGSFYMDGDYAIDLVLNELHLTNPDSAAINIQDGKLIGVKLADGTTNSLADGLTNVAADDSDGHKAAFYTDGHTSWTGTGSLTITGNVKHAFDSDEYTLLNAGLGTITVAGAQGDGFHISQYFKMQGGTVNITSIGDGIDVEMKKSDKTDNGNMIIEGGTLNVTTTGDATKALKCDNNMVISGGVIKATTTGSAIYDASVADISSNSAAKCDGTFTMTNGTVTLSSSGAGGKGLNSTGAITISGGTLTSVTTGTIFVHGAEDSKPQSIKCDTDIILSGGTILSCASTNSGTAFKTDFRVLTNGATVMGIGNKATTPAATSTHGYKKYSGVNVTSGSTLSYDGVSFTIPSGYAISNAKVFVSSPSM